MKNLFFLLFIICMFSCSSSKINRKFNSSVKTSLFRHHLTGFMLYDPDRSDTIVNYNANQYFTPASNVKIFTLYTALSILGDSIPATKYSTRLDTITMMGTGNPTLLHPYFKDSSALQLASSYEKIELVLDNFDDDKYGPGWAWEDYDTQYSAERSGFPIYGNVLRISNNSQLEVSPSIFKEKVFFRENGRHRAETENSFFVSEYIDEEIFVPFIIDSLLIKSIWHNILDRPVQLTPFDVNGSYTILYSKTPPDSLYKRMMHESDNFLAEQIMILCSAMLSDTLKFETSRDFILQGPLKNMPFKPRWVDGSGLSRYNLFTPSSMVHVLMDLYMNFPEKYLFHLFPSGGENGTIKEWFGSPQESYIFGKSGSLGNNYNFSGYLKTKSGKTLILSFMNNHYMTSSSSIKREMQLLFEFIRDHY